MPSEDDAMHVAINFCKGLDLSKSHWENASFNMIFVRIILIMKDS